MATKEEKKLLLDALERAYFSGTVKVKYADREINYRSLEEMSQLIDQLKRQLGKGRGIKHIVASYSSGLK